MTLANPVKGEVAVKTAAASFTLCFSWAAQKAIARKFGKPRFLDVAETIGDLSDDDFEFVLLSALQHRHPDLTEADVGALISELGYKTVSDKLGESLALAFDMGSAIPAGGPPVARSEAGTPTPASSSGSPSA